MGCFLATHFEQIRVVSIPNDLDASEAFRYATGIIAQAEESRGRLLMG